MPIGCLRLSLRDTRIIVEADISPAGSQPVFSWRVIAQKKYLID